MNDSSKMPTVMNSEGQRNVAGWRWILGVFVIAAVGLAIFSGDRLDNPSSDTHFVYLANTYNSMIAASFSDEAAERREDRIPYELDREPPHGNDWASHWEVIDRDGNTYEGNWQERVGSGPFLLLGTNTVVHLERRDVESSTRRYFVSFPPAPAWLMMPLAAISGYDINDVLFTLFFAALNIVLIFLLLERLASGGLTGRSIRDNLWLTALFGFGTVHLWCAILGQVWFTALILGITFTLAYILCAIDARRPFWAGLFLALAFATRTPLLFSAIFFFASVFFPGGSWIGLQRHKLIWAAKKLALFCLPCLVIGIGLLWMNYVRFADPTEFGHRMLRGGIIPHVQEYGLFHWAYLSKNLSAAFTLMPVFQTEYPYVQISRHGMSLLLTTPAFLYLLWPRERETTGAQFLYRLCWLTVVVVAIPGFFYENTGYVQFGYRFSLDFTVYLIALLALGRRPLTWLFKACIIAGILVNAFGAITFKRLAEFYVGGRGDFFV